MVRFLAEVEVRRDGVFEEVNEKIAAEDEEGGTASAQREAGGNHFGDGGGEHESGAERHEVLEIALLPVALNENEPAENVGESGGEAEGEAEQSDTQEVLRSSFFVLRGTALKAFFVPRSLFFVRSKRTGR